MVPDKAAAMPNLPLFRMFIATLNPPPTPENKQHHQCKGHNPHISNSHTYVYIYMSQMCMAFKMY